MRTFIRRVYHHVTPDKLGDPVCEFCYRFSHPEMYGSHRVITWKTRYTLCQVVKITLIFIYILTSTSTPAGSSRCISESIV